jgi:hypothetical protein
MSTLQSARRNSTLFRPRTRRTDSQLLKLNDHIVGVTNLPDDAIPKAVQRAFLAHDSVELPIDVWEVGLEEFAGRRVMTIQIRGQAFFKKLLRERSGNKVTEDGIITREIADGALSLRYEEALRELRSRPVKAIADISGKHRRDRKGTDEDSEREFWSAFREASKTPAAQFKALAAIVDTAREGIVGPYERLYRAFLEQRSIYLIITVKREDDKRTTVSVPLDLATEIE